MPLLAKEEMYFIATFYLFKGHALQHLIHILECPQSNKLDYETFPSCQVVDHFQIIAAKYFS